MNRNPAPRSRRLADVVDRGARILSCRSETPRLDAELLAAGALGIARHDLHRDPSRPLSPVEVERIAGRIRRRARGEPVAYLLGEREFGSLSFAVDSRVLVPRPETEHLVEEAVRRLRAIVAARSTRVPVGPVEPVEPIRMLDLGTGSGSIAVTVAHRVPEVRVLAIDRSREALRVARHNAARHGVRRRVRFACAHWLEALGSTARFDVVASNPPYVPADAMESLPRDVRDHEPRSALCSGEDAFTCHREIAATAFDRLRPGGWLLLETAGETAESTEGAGGASGPERFAWLDDWTETAWLRDLAGRPRVLVARRRAP